MCTPVIRYITETDKDQDGRRILITDSAGVRAREKGGLARACEKGGLMGLFAETGKQIDMQGRIAAGFRQR